MLFYLVIDDENGYPGLTTNEQYEHGSVYKTIEAETFEDAIIWCKEIDNYAIDLGLVRGFIIRPQEEPLYTVIKPNKSSISRIIEGYPEYKKPHDLDAITIICNDEGKLLRMPLNRGLYCQGVMYDIIAGTFIVTCINEDDEYDDMSDVLLAKVYEYFKEPEIFMFDKNKDEIITIKCNNRIAKIMRDNNISIIA